MHYSMKIERLRVLSRSRQAAYSTVSLRLCFATVSCLMGHHQKAGVNNEY